MWHLGTHLVVGLAVLGEWFGYSLGGLKGVFQPKLFHDSVICHCCLADPPSSFQVSPLSCLQPQDLPASLVPTALILHSPVLESRDRAFNFIHNNFLIKPKLNAYFKTYEQEQTAQSYALLNKKIFVWKEVWCQITALLMGLSYSQVCQDVWCQQRGPALQRETVAAA